MFLLFHLRPMLECPTSYICVFFTKDFVIIKIQVILDFVPPPPPVSELDDEAPAPPPVAKIDAEAAPAPAPALESAAALDDAAAAEPAPLFFNVNENINHSLNRRKFRCRSA